MAAPLQTSAVSPACDRTPRGRPATMDAREIAQCALQIERATADRSYGDILTLLCDLDEVELTAEQLQTTNIVKALYGLLKTCSDEGSVKKTARSLLSRWKKQCGEGARGAKCAGGTDPEADVAGVAGVCREGDVNRAEEDASPSGANGGLQTLSFTASCRFSPVRSRCVQLLLASLCPDLPDQDKAAELARNIEQRVYERHRPSQLKYKACVRSKVANLRNPKSQHLRRGLLSGSLSPEAFARMSAEEMAGAELRQLREAYSARGVSERQLPRGVEGTQTDKVRCERCGGSDCRVTQVSRGALFLPAWVRRGGPDEDAMTFVTCGGCGQQWYHSGWICL